MLKRKITLILLLLLIILNIILTPKITPKKQKNSKEKTEYMTLIIKKINLKEKIYNLNDKRNNIEEHVTILKESIMPDKENSILFIAAHSGTGKIAYFEKLDKLKEGDEIVLIYNKKYIKYYVKDIWEENKNGYINVNKEKEKQLILTTCSPHKKNKQLIINCIKKD